MMDIHKLPRQDYRRSTMVSVGISVGVVVLTALLGRGFMNIKGALTKQDPDVLSAVAALEKNHFDVKSIVKSEELRKKDDTHDFLIETRQADGGRAWYMVRLRRTRDKNNREVWGIDGKPELLRGNPDAGVSVPESTSASTDLPAS